MTDLVLPAKVRKVLYIILAILGLAAGAIPVGYQSVGASVPHWYLVGASVFAFVVAAPFTLAVLNTHAGDPYLTATVEPTESSALAQPAGNDAGDELDPAAEPEDYDTPTVGKDAGPADEAA